MDGEIRKRKQTPVGVTNEPHAQAEASSSALKSAEDKTSCGFCIAACGALGHVIASFCILAFIYVVAALLALLFNGYLSSAEGLIPTLSPDPLWEARYFEAPAKALLPGTRPDASVIAIPCARMHELQNRDKQEIEGLIRRFTGQSSASPRVNIDDVLPLTCIEDDSVFAANGGKCVVSVGPVIGEVNTNSVRVLVEVTSDTPVTVTLHRLKRTPDPDAAGHDGFVDLNQDLQAADRASLYATNASISSTMELSAFKANVFSFNDLIPGSGYAVEISGCDYPLQRLPNVLGAAHGYFRTFPSSEASRSELATTPSKVGITSCNNIVRMTPRPKSSLFRHLATHSLGLRTAFHLGDQVYSDSKRLGPYRSAYEAAQTIVMNDIRQLWQLYQLSQNSDSVDLPHYLTAEELFAKNPGSEASLAADLVSAKSKEAIVELFRSLYRDTWGGSLTEDAKQVAFAATRIALATVSNIMLLDDHDLFDDLADVGIDFHPHSLRRLVIDCGLKAYLEFQDSVALSSTFHPTSSRYYFPYVSVEERLKKLQALIKVAETPLSLLTKLGELKPITTLPTWRFIRLGPSLHNQQICVIMIDTRLQRDPQWVVTQEHAYLRGVSTATDNATSPIHQNPPYGFLGKAQWAMLESLLSVNGSRAQETSDCTTLILTSSIPFVFFSKHVTALVAKSHDDMLGQWSGPSFFAEQIRVLNLATAWRDDASTQQSRSVVLVGGDVHTGGVTEIVPHNTFVSGKEYTAEKPVWQFVTSTITNDPLALVHFYPLLGSSSFSNRIGLIGANLPDWAKYVFAFRHKRWLQDHNYGLLDFNGKDARVRGTLVRGSDFVDGWTVDEPVDLS